MTSDATTTRRTLTGLSPRRTTANPDVSRLLRATRERTDPVPNEAPAPAAESEEAQPAEPVGPASSTSGGVGPKYLQMVRKEARIRDDQADWLTAEVRRINAARRRGTTTVGERITENTIIRIAIDRLMQDDRLLIGTTEDELRAVTDQ